MRVSNVNYCNSLSQRVVASTVLPSDADPARFSSHLLKRIQRGLWVNLLELLWLLQAKSTRMSEMMWEVIQAGMGALGLRTRPT